MDSQVEIHSNSVQTDIANNDFFQISGRIAWKRKASCRKEERQRETKKKIVMLKKRCKSDGGLRFYQKCRTRINSKIWTMNDDFLSICDSKNRLGKGFRRKIQDRMR